MKQIPILGLGINSGFPSVTSQERINCYIEELKDAEKTRTVAYGTPGKTTFVNLGSTPVRGWISFGDFVYLVNKDGFYKLNNAGTATLIGTIGTSQGYVSMACTGFEIFIADGTALGKVYNLASGAFSASNAPALTAVCFLDGYIIGNKPDTGQYYWCNLYDALTWNALSFATAESNPDNLVAVFADHGGIMLLGTFTTEIVGNSAGEDSPFSRIGYPVEWGLMAKSSVAKLGDAVAFLARNRMGEAQVVLMSGYNPQRISTHDLERILNNSTSLESATAFSFMLNGHSFYQLNAGGMSWLYDLSSGTWSQLKSYGLEFDKGNLAINLINRILIADYSNGKIYTLSDDSYADDSDPLVMSISSKGIFNNAQWMTIAELDIELETGAGATTGQGSDPQIMLEVSKDSGHTWGNPRWVSMGMTGEYKKLVRWPRIGRSYNFAFRITISDPIKRCIIGAWVTASD
jgi:hypothetical protein